ncbi:1-pyrroline-5-carboxylate dehydrogenase [Vibrio algivorus]|uniref:1-pyrroline-5-carboxylate dehydrogenase n=1 Tax=Vibrio algivorus TaxID=1667024 RepID=A0A557P4S9_9VIBR|nr:1-pyrroline-5-carboxylate dehydrogenase [Vibrio algivorus]TVO35683.1 1-pyrroline-5-carboxylate dehydrogenase [Vibrio algivorus]
MQTITRFSEVTFFDANTAWEQWNLTEYTFKSECLRSVSRNLEETQPALSAVMNFHLQQANERLSEPKLMPGPTGETNELYTAGRGICALIVEPGMPWVAVIAPFTAALIAGNAVLICCDDKALNQCLENAISNVLPAHLVHIVAYDSYQSVIEADIRLTAFVGRTKTQRSINADLAHKKGAIVPFIAETIADENTQDRCDSLSLVQAHDPSFVLRFITERTRTINITAVGGNATLLELGNQH